MKKSKWKLILALVLVVVLAAGSVAGYFALAHQNASQILDRTQEGEAQKPEKDKNSTGDDGDIPSQAVLSQNVVMFTDKESKKINNAILSLNSLDSGVEMEIESGSAMEDMGVGDIFFLPGDEDTPFGMTYIGKISSVIPGDDSSTYLLETPMMDEVFDVLKFSEEGLLTPENLVSVECVPGVSLMGQEEQASGLANTGGGYVATTLASSGGQVVPLGKVNGQSTDELVFTVGVDLAKLMGLKKEPASPEDEVDFMEAGSVNVYITSNGKRYHRENCSYIKTSTKTTLENALKDGYTSCAKCKPPVRKDDDGVANHDAKLELSGYFGVKDVTYSATCNWDLLNGGGLEDLYFDVEGTITAGVKVDGSLEWEISGRTTKYKLNDKIGFEGLKERLFPLAAIHYAVGLTPTPVAMGGAGNAQIRALTSPVPLSVVGIIYVDGHGKLTAGFSGYFNYEKPFEYHKTIVRNGEMAYEKDYKPGNEKVEFGMEFEVTADMDLHLGCGLDLYIFNLKVMQLDLAQVGVETAGEAKLQYSTAVANGEEDIYEWDVHTRGYFKLLQLKLGLQAKAEILPKLDLSFDAKYDFCLWDYTLFEYGKPSGTRYDPSTMSYSHVAAKDSTNKYFKDVDGKLILERDTRSVLWDQDFFTICGIDQSYIYILENGEEGHNIRRIAKDGKTSKVVAEGVYQFLTIDEKCIYFVPTFDKTTIRRLNRGSCDIDTLADFPKEVIHMVCQGENFYLAVGKPSVTGFYGDYILMDKKGNTLANYGNRPAVENMEKVDFKTYDVAKKVSSSGYLRDTAESIYWVGADGSSKRIQPVTGWNYFEGGIITMEYGSGGYNIALYQAADGARVVLGQAKHSHALFTAAQDDDGRWYYVDQTSSDVILYTVSADLGGARVVQTIPRSQFPVDLSNCSVEMVDNQLYFYSIVNNNECRVLHIYNLY